MHNIGPAIGVPGNSSMNLPQSSNLYAVAGAIPSAYPSPTAEGHTLVSSLAGARPLGRAASIATSFGGKSRVPPPYEA
jgi:hypothetical protein